MRHGILTKGAELSIAHFTPVGDPSGTVGSFSEVFNIMRMPSLGGEKERVETTTLKDAAHTYIAGLIEYGELEFQLLYDNDDAVSNYRVLAGLGDEIVRCRVELGDKKPTGNNGTIFEFDAQLSASIDEQEPNQAITFTCRAMLQSDIELKSNPD